MSNFSQLTRLASRLPAYVVEDLLKSYGRLNYQEEALVLASAVALRKAQLMRSPAGGVCLSFALECIFPPFLQINNALRYCTREIEVRNTRLHDWQLPTPNAHNFQELITAFDAYHVKAARHGYPIAELGRLAVERPQHSPKNSTFEADCVAATVPGAETRSHGSSVENVEDQVDGVTNA